MAVIFKEDEENEQKQGPGSSGAMQTSSAPMAGGAGQGTSVARQQQGSGQAPNIQKYIQANQGAGSQLAEGLKEQAQKQAQSLQRGVDTSRTAFQQKAGELEGKLGEQGEQLVKSSFKDPQAILQNQSQLEEFKRLQSGGYQDQIGQTQQNLTPFQQQQQQLAQAGQMAGTEGGRFQLLQQTFGKPTYSQGQQRLDQLLLQGAPNATRTLQYDIGELAKQAGQQINQLGEEQKAKLEALQNLSSTRSQQIQDMLQFGETQDVLESDLSGRGLRDIQNDLEARMRQVQETAPQQVAGLRERLASNKLTQKDLDTLGLSAGTRLYNTDLAQFINQSDVSPTIAGIANQDEFARFQALRQLAGDTEADIFGGAQQVGGYRPYEFDSARLEDTLKQKETDFQNLLSSTRQSLTTPFYTGPGGEAIEFGLNRGYANSDPQYEPLRRLYRSIRDVRAANQPSYEQMRELTSAYEAMPTWGRQTLVGPGGDYNRVIQELMRQMPGYEYERVLNPVPEDFRDVGQLI